MDPAATDRENGISLRRLRAMLGVVFVLGSLGTVVELLLLGHYEGISQLIPLALLAVSLTLMTSWFIAGGPGLLHVFRLSMLLCVIGGGLGIYLHYRSNVEFELELNPSARGVELLRESVTGAMPVLAPGTMLQLGLVGLLYTFRHPVFRRSKPGESLTGETQ